MKIEKKKINGYDVFIHKTKKYTSIHMRFLFEMPYTKENIYKYDLLEEYQIHSSNKYKTRKALKTKRLELYSFGYSLNNYNIGEKMIIEASFQFYDPELIGENFLKEALEFAREILFYPNFEGGKLDLEELTRCKTNMIAAFKDDLLSLKKREWNNFVKTLFPNTYKMTDNIETVEEYEALLNSFSCEDLIKAHEEWINHTLIGVVVMGNVKKDFLKYLEEMFKFEEAKPLDEEYNEIISIDPKVKDFNHVIDNEYKESIVRAVYTYKTADLKDKYTYYAITRMMSGSGMLVHKTLRDELGIVYTAGASRSKKLDYITMSAVIDAQNVDAALEGFENVLNKLKDVELVTKLLDKIKEEADMDEYIFDESKWNVFYELYDLSFNFDISNKEKNDLIKSLTVEDILKAVDEMKLRTVIFYEGGKK